VSTIIASTLAIGSLSVYNAANNIQSLPISVIGVSLAIAAFPYFSQALVERDERTFVQHFSLTVRRVLFFIIPASILLLLLRAQIVRVVLGAGAFDWEDTVLTAQTLGFFSLSLFAQSLIPTFARSFYALEDTRTPVRVAITAVVLNVIGSITLSAIFGVLGLAISFSFSSFVHMLVLYLLLRRRVRSLDDQRIFAATLRITAAALVMGGTVWGMLRLLALGVDMQTFVGIFLQGAIAGVVGIVVYLIIAASFRFDEARVMLSWLRALKRQVTNGNGRNE